MFTRMRLRLLRIQYLIPLLSNPCPSSIISHYVIWWSLYTVISNANGIIVGRRPVSDLFSVSPDISPSRCGPSDGRGSRDVATKATAGKLKEPKKKSVQIMDL